MLFYSSEFAIECSSTLYCLGWKMEIKSILYLHQSFKGLVSCLNLLENID